MNIYEILGLIFLEIPLLIGVIAVIVEKLRSGKSWIGQGYGRK